MCTLKNIRYAMCLLAYTSTEQVSQSCFKKASILYSNHRVFVSFAVFYFKSTSRNSSLSRNLFLRNGDKTLINYFIETETEKHILYTGSIYVFFQHFFTCT
jgi:hypothetical protein